MHIQLQSASADINSIQKFKPVFTVALYKANVDVVGNHLSGLLLFKKMHDSSTKVVFSNEMTLSFFDLNFAAVGEFNVYKKKKKIGLKDT